MTPDPDLSPAGRARRDHIGRLAVRAAVARRHRRTAARAAVAVAVVAAAAVVAVVRPRRPAGQPAVAVRAATPVPSPPTGTTVTFVPTDPTVVARLRVDPAAPHRWRSIGDRELLDALAAAGRPAGLVRTADGRAVLVEP